MKHDTEVVLRIVKSAIKRSVERLEQDPDYENNDTLALATVPLLHALDVLEAYEFEDEEQDDEDREDASDPTVVRLSLSRAAWKAMQEAIYFGISDGMYRDDDGPEYAEIMRALGIDPTLCGPYKEDIARLLFR